ncbi:LamG domain-containing protein [Vibrio phage V-YDF132]|nr:LamG domain-containing protein [Vibrio phage V-YDF132]
MTVLLKEFVAGFEVGLQPVLVPWTTEFKGLGTELMSEFTSEFRSRTDALAVFESEFGSTTQITVPFTSAMRLLTNTSKLAEFKSSCMVGGGQATVIVVEDTPVVTIRGIEIPHSEVTIRNDEDRQGFSATVTVADYRVLPQIARDDVAMVSIGAQVYRFLVDTAPVNVDAQAEFSASLKLVSPLKAMDTPRATKMSKAWDKPTAASSIVSELLGATEWHVTDWVLPEYRLAVENQTPLQIAKQLADATGAIITTTPLGKPVVQKKYPVPTNKYDMATVDFEFNDLEHLITTKEEAVPQDGTNSVLIYDTTTQESSALDKMEFDVRSPSSGILSVFPSPVRNLEVTHTAREPLGLDLVVGLTTIEKTALVEVFKGEAEVNYPIDSLVKIDYVSLDITGLRYAKGSTKIYTDDLEAYGVINVTYKTQVKQYRVSGVESPAVQFLLNEVADND